MEIFDYLKGTFYLTGATALFIWAFSGQKKRRKLKYWKKLIIRAAKSYIMIPLALLLFSMGIVTGSKRMESVQFFACSTVIFLAFIQARKKSPEAFVFVTGGIILFIICWFFPIYVFMTREIAKAPEYYPIFVSSWLFIASIFTFTVALEGVM